MTDLSTQSPAQIDGQLAELYGRQEAILSAIVTKRLDIKRARRRPTVANGEAYVAQCEAVIVGLTLDLGAVEAEMAPFEAEYVARGRWNRAFLAVTNGRGHVHRSTECSTCHNGEYRTELTWMTAFSGMSQAEIIEAAGERACTVCYPDAPVGVKGTRMFSQDERDAEVARQARVDAKAAKEAGFVNDPETGEFLFKTERGATNFVASELSSMHWYGQTHPSYPQWAAKVRQVVRAVAAKRGTDAEALYEEMDAKAARKVAKDRREVEG